MSSPTRSPKIGLSVNFMHADPMRPVFKGMTLQYLEQRMAQAVYRCGAIPLVLPDLGDPEADRGVGLHGGSAP